MLLVTQAVPTSRQPRKGGTQDGNSRHIVEVEMSFEDEYHAIHFLMYCAALAYHSRCAWVFSIGL